MKTLISLLCALITVSVYAAGAGDISTGVTAVATTSDTAVTAIAANTSQTFLELLTIDNEGAAAGFFSIDGGTTWMRLPANQITTVPIQQLYNGLKVKRVAGGTDLSSIYAWAN